MMLRYKGETGSRTQTVRPHSLLFRLATGTAVSALLLTQVMPLPALAQPAPPQAGAAQYQGGDPPARVGRLARATGTVSFHTADADQWSPASPNYPITSGDGFWTEPNAQAELQIDASRIQLAGGTEFDVGLLDDSGLQATQGRGEISLNLRGTRPGEAWSVQTPRGLVTLSGDGRYAIVAGDTATPTTVTVLDGAAQVTGPGVSLPVAAGQAAIITGDQTFQGNLAPAQQDGFLAAMLQRERPPPRLAVAPPSVVETMPGGADLAAYGSWAEAPDYGPVWYPQVASDWVPYRDGHWAWVAPWGWTWVDSDPWGFAPFHYGRWVELHGRWAWTPGVVAFSGPPVYAPALVTFFGLAAGVGIGAALAAGSVGWYPLGPREAYRPWYHHSDRYLRDVNRREVTNFATIDRPIAAGNYVNRRAATVVPTGVMQTSRPVRQAAQRVDPRALSAARPVLGRQPVAPTRATFGVTAATARQTPLAPTPAGVAAMPRGAAPGPALRAVGPAAVPGAARPQPGTLARPPLYTPQERGAVRPGTPQPGRPSPALVRPGAGPAPTPAIQPGRPSPALVRPGAGPIPAPAIQPGRPGMPHPTPPVPSLATPGERPTLRPGGTPVPAVVSPHVQPGPTSPQRPTAPIRPAPLPGAMPAVPRPAERPAGATPNRAPERALPLVQHPSGAVGAAPPALRAPAPAAPQMRTAPPRVEPPPPVRAAPPPARVAPPAPQVHPAPPPQVRAAPPPARVAPPAPQVRPAPPPQVRAAPPPARVAPPAPQVHPAPPPQVRAAPPPAQHPPPERQKRPGEP